jgi:hypothetical protein
MLHALTAAVIVLLAANQAAPPADAFSPDAPPAATPRMAIVGGKRVQPRVNTGQAAPDAAGINKRDADDVDRLYQELMRQTAPGAGQGSGSTMPAQ